MRVPIEMFVNKNLMPNDLTLSQLIKMSKVEGVSEKIIALPDVHYKFNTSFKFSIPTGTVVLCKDKIIPKFINLDCGMCIITTNINLNNLDSVNIDNIFNLLKGKVSVSMREEPVISDNDLHLILKDGVKWAFEKYNFNKNEINNIYDCTDLISYNNNLDYIESVLPKQYTEIGKLSPGILGTGNHFIEMQKIDKIIDKKSSIKF